MLTIIDEYLRFPFTIPCNDMHSDTVIKALSSIFSIFGMPAYVHSNRGKSFISSELKSYLNARGITNSMTTPYNPSGNGQCERYNATIWKAIVLTCKSRNIDIKHWEEVLPYALH